jgi:hypothetical protein
MRMLAILDRLKVSKSKRGFMDFWPILKAAGKQEAPDFPYKGLIPRVKSGTVSFHLRTGVAGKMLQKFVNSGVKLAILGDVSAYTAASSALRDFIYESNRGEAIWFVADRHELEQRLG